MGFKMFKRKKPCRKIELTDAQQEIRDRVTRIIESEEAKVSSELVEHRKKVDSIMDALLPKILDYMEEKRIRIFNIKECPENLKGALNECFGYLRCLPYTRFINVGIEIEPDFVRNKDGKTVSEVFVILRKG